MKRKPVPYSPVIHRWYAIFQWKECYECRMEFRREWGWRIEQGPYFNGRGRFIYVCAHCAPAYEDAEELKSQISSLPKNLRPPG